MRGREERLIGAIVLNEAELNIIGRDKEKFKEILKEKLASFELSFFETWQHNVNRKALHD